MEKEDKVLSFSFYEETSYEDAGPYLHGNKMIVCDGCGGAGGFYHVVDPDKIDSFDKIKKLVLEDEHDDSSDWFLEEYFKPIYEEPKVNRTSAFWASRIALARFAFFVRDVKDLQDEAFAYVSDGLKHVAKELDLKAPLIGSKTLLPTTLVAISVLNSDKKHFDAEVCWAGDSRAYVMSKDGLKQLTIDDEDDSGAITNLFTAKEDFETKMHLRNYSLAQPCALFTCSDGLFDNLSDLDFEYLLLELMDEANSIDEYKEKVREFYHAHKSDDCTMAFMAFGFDSYQNMKDYYQERREYVRNLHHQYVTYRNNLELKEKPERYEDYLQKIISRTKDKQKDILNTIFAEYHKNGQCNLISEELKKEIAKEYATNLDKQKEEYEKTKAEAITLIKDEIAIRIVDTPIDHYFDNNLLNDEQKAIIEPVLEKQHDLIEASMRTNLFNHDKEKYVRLCENLINTVNRVFDAFDSIGIAERKVLAEGRSGLEEKLKEGKWEKEEIEPLLDIVANLNNDKEFKENFLEFANYESRLNRARIDADYIEKQSQALLKALEPLYEKPDELLDIGLYFHFDFLARYALEKVRKMKLSKEGGSALTLEIIMEYLENKGPEKIVECRLKAGHEETCIDKFYNVTLLKTLITYYEVMNKGSEEFDNFYEEYLKFNKDVYSLLKKK